MSEGIGYGMRTSTAVILVLFILLVIIHDLFNPPKFEPFGGCFLNTSSHVSFHPPYLHFPKVSLLLKQKKPKC
jgi:hypothetical protein